MSSSNLEFISRVPQDRYTLFPISHRNLWNFYKKHLSTFWIVEEIKLSDDKHHWENLKDGEKHFIKMVLAFFAGSDGIVNENLVLNFYNEVQIPEVRNFYSVQIMMEAIHSETYSLLLDTYITNTDEKMKLFKAIDTIPAVKQKADWALKWVDNTLTNEGFAKRLLAFICVEGLFFSGSFCAIYWLKSRGIMPGLCTANEFISRDENLHCEFAIELYRMLPEKLSVPIVHKLFREAIDIETQFVTESLPVSLIGMNCGLMTQYIHYVADRWLVLLGYPKLYNTDNPFPFMEMISLNTKGNFFEREITEYSKSGINSTEKDKEISFDSDF